MKKNIKKINDSFYLKEKKFKQINVLIKNWVIKSNEQSFSSN